MRKKLGKQLHITQSCFVRIYCTNARVTEAEMISKPLPHRSKQAGQRAYFVDRNPRAKQIPKIHFQV